MNLEIEGAGVIANPGMEQIAEALASVDGGRSEFAILGPADDSMTYMQVSGNSKDGFSLEHQKGSLKQHYFCADDRTLEQIIAAFESYARGDGQWRTACRWEL